MMGRKMQTLRRSLSMPLGLAALLVLLCGLQPSLAQARTKSIAKTKTKTKTEDRSPAPEASPPEPDSPKAAPAASPAPAAAAASSPTAPLSEATAQIPAPATKAAPAPPLPKLSKSDIDGAKAQASAHFQAGRYSDAAEMLLRVYEAEPQPLYLFNAGQAYRKGDKPREAKTTYQRFLDVAPTHRLAPEVRGYVKDMDTILATQQKAQQISLELDKEKTEAQFARQALLQERGKPLYKRPVFWVLVGSGVLVALTALSIGVYFAEVSKSDLGTQRVVLP